MSAIFLSILFLPTASLRWPSTTIWTTSVRVYSTVPTPTTMIDIVNNFSPVVTSGSVISRNPTVVIVVTVMYMASISERPNAR